MRTELTRGISHVCVRRDTPGHSRGVGLIVQTPPPTRTTEQTSTSRSALAPEAIRGTHLWPSAKSTVREWSTLTGATLMLPSAIATTTPTGTPVPSSATSTARSSPTIRVSTSTRRPARVAPASLGIVLQTSAG